MAGMKNPAKRLCEIISRVQDPTAVHKFDFLCFLSILDGKIRDVARALSGALCVYHLDRGHVVLIKSCGGKHGENKVGENRT